MVSQEHLEVLKQRVAAWNDWRRGHPEMRPDLSEADLRRANLSRANLSGANLILAILNEAILNETVLIETNLILADISNADLRGAYLSGADLRGAILSGATLNGADLSGANLSGAYFSGALREVLSRAKLSGTIRREANISEALRRALSGATLGRIPSRADLSGANLSKADLSGADLSKAILREANLRGADLSKAILRGARLNGADLSGANLSGANLQRSTIGWTTFGTLDLSNVIGLETVKHDGPSIIGIDTVYLSKGNIPEVFLRGAGVPDSFITYMRSLVAQPVEFYSCFISYSSKDQEFANRLYIDLQANGVRCWFAPEDMKIGDEIRDRIDQSIRLYDKLLLVLSEHSVSSQWVNDEVEAALEKEQKQGRPVLFPIALDEAVNETSKGWAAAIRRRRHIGDLRDWKQHDAYQKGFQRLLRDLKAETSNQASS